MFPKLIPNYDVDNIQGIPDSLFVSLVLNFSAYNLFSVFAIGYKVFHIFVITYMCRNAEKSHRFLRSTPSTYL